MNRKTAIVVALVAGLMMALPARAQYAGNPGAFVAISQTQLGNLGYARYRGFGARALGMGGAYIALADDLTAASWNPAGLAQQAAPTVSAGLAYGSLDADQTSVLHGISDVSGSWFDMQVDRNQPFRFKPSDSETHLDYFAGAYPLRVSDEWRLGFELSYFKNLVFDQDLSQDLGRVAVDYHVYNENPELGGVEPISSSRFLIDRGRAAQHHSGDLSTISLTAAASWKETVFLGLGISRWDGSLDGSDLLYEHGVFGRLDGVGNMPSPQTVEPFSQRFLNLDFSGWSVSLGALFKLPKGWRIGVVYKPSFTLDTDGCIDNLQGEQGSSNGVEWGGCRQGEPPSGTVRNLYDFNGGEVDYPDAYGLGVAWQPAFGWVLTADWTHTSWGGATLKSADGSVVLTFPSLMVLDDTRPIQPSETGKYVQGTTQGYEQFDGDVFRIGGEYLLSIGKGFDLPVRLGFFTEDAYRNLPGVGHSMKVTGISAGIGLYHLPRWMLDFAMVYESMDQGLGSNDTYYDLRTFAGQQYYRVKLDYGSSGSDFSQSSFRMLLNFSYVF